MNAIPMIAACLLHQEPKTLTVSCWGCQRAVEVPRYTARLDWQCPDCERAGR